METDIAVCITAGTGLFENKYEYVILCACVFLADPDCLFVFYSSRNNNCPSHQSEWVCIEYSNFNISICWSHTFTQGWMPFKLVSNNPEDSRKQSLPNREKTTWSKPLIKFIGCLNRERSKKRNTSGTMINLRTEIGYDPNQGEILDQITC